MDPAVILAYAIFDAESTTRLSEHPEAFEEYVSRGRKLLAALINYRPAAERECVANAICNTVALTAVAVRNERLIDALRPYAEETGYGLDGTKPNIAWKVLMEPALAAVKGEMRKT